MESGKGHASGGTQRALTRAAQVFVCGLAWFGWGAHPARAEAGEASGTVTLGAEKNGEGKAKTKTKKGAEPTAGPRAAPAPVLGFGPGFFSEDTEVVSNRRVNGQKEPAERDELVSDGFFNLAAWLWLPIFHDRVRWGAGLSWYNSYTLVPDEDDFDDNERFDVGQVFQLFAQAEYVLPDVAGKLDVLFGFRAGGLVLFSGRDVEDRLEELENLGYDVTQLPRFGAFLGPHVGVLWPLNDRLSVRLDGGVQFSKIVLYDTSAEVQGSKIELGSHLNTTRIHFQLGLEFAL